VKQIVRYLRNQKTISSHEQEILARAKVAIVGCGGLGCYVVEMLARIGVGFISVVDYETFEETNLNRQLYATVKTIGKYKVLSAEERLKLVNPETKVNLFLERITEENGFKILKGHDAVIDAVDDIPTKLLLEKICEDLGIPLVHGAVAGWFGQVSSVFPGDKTISFIYKDKKEGIEKELGTPSFTPAVIAGIQVAETIKIILKKDPVLRRKILFIDLLSQEYQKIEL